jgi:hypothetical protein
MSMKKAIATLLLTVLGLALLVYSAARSLNFIMATLPADKQILAYFGLAALDGGLILWLLFFLYGAAGPWQRGAALLMTGVDLVGAVAMFTLDTLFESGQSGMTAAMTESEIKTAILALSGVIALNIAATVFSHIMDPEARKKRAKEEAQDKIEDKALAKIDSSADLLAEQLSNDIAAGWQAEILATYRAALGKQSRLILEGVAHDIDSPPPAKAGAVAIPQPGKNGRKPSESETQNLLETILAAVQPNREGQRSYSADTVQADPTKNEIGGGI